MIQCFTPFRVQKTGDCRIAVVSAHHWSFACQVAVVDGRTGKVMSEYWHRGHLKHLAVADIDGDGNPEILLGGVNDAPEYKQATVLIFDGRNIRGVCRNPGGQPYFSGMPAGTEKSRIFFPRTVGSVGREFNIVTDLRVTADRIVITVSESVGGLEPYFAIYELDQQLQAANLMLSYELKQLYNKLQAEGKLPRESPAETEQHLREGIRVERI
jgi:hypothetical protein